MTNVKKQTPFHNLANQRFYHSIVTQHCRNLTYKNISMHPE